MSELNGKTILVVGANGAFGIEFCQQLMNLGAQVIGTARAPESASRLNANLAQRLLLDLNESASIQTLADYLNGSNAEIDGIVFASGLVAFGPVQETPAQVAARLIQVNAIGQIELANRLIPRLATSAAKNNEPFILTISGIISENPMAGLAAYSASKAALLAYSKAAAKELKKLGIRWLDARPGHTDSGLANRAIFGTAPNFGNGMAVPAVVTRMVSAISNDETDLPSSSFQI
jgi:cyclic-di-GMP-binding biofilm dispersal mediator protein